MGKDSRIEWTHHTFNPWWGCVRVSAACDHCYADAWAKRLGEDLWGPHSERRFFSDAHWKEPLKWNREAEADGVRRRVFCASMADVFENRKDLMPHRLRLLELIKSTPHLDWLLLTKRIHLVKRQLPRGYTFPSNVWLVLRTAAKRDRCSRVFDTRRQRDANRLGDCGRRVRCRCSANESRLAALLEGAVRESTRTVSFQTVGALGADRAGC
jgi:protein gp37